METSDVIAGLAFVLSIISLGMQWRFSKRQDELNRLSIERERADVSASKRGHISARFERFGQHSYKLFVSNDGPATASHVGITLIEGGELLHGQDVREKFPIASLPSGQTVPIMARIHMQSPRRLIARFTWNDEAGGGSEELTLHPF